MIGNNEVIQRNSLRLTYPQYTCVGYISERRLLTTVTQLVISFQSQAITPLA